MEFMSSNSYRSACRRPWQKSMDSQEFGFASNMINSMEVAPADELFFKGQLLPLQMDPTLHLVQALSNCAQEAGSRGELPSRISYWCQDEGVIDYNSSSDSIVDHCPLLERELSMLSWCKDKEPIEGDIIDLDFKASIQNHKPHLDQAPPCHQDPPAAPSSLSIWCKDEEIKGPWLSNWSKDEEISFNSCRIEGDVVDVHYKRSSSFRSQNSGFWESGADKDTGDSSSSSRDSNGSSQDSYFPNTIKLETPSFAAHYPHTKASFNILWKSLFKKASKKQTSSSPISISRKGFSEDLSKYKECSAPSLKEAKEAMLPWKLNEQRSTCNQEKKGKGKGKGMSSINDRSISGCKTTSSLCDAAKEAAGPNKPTATSKSLMSKGKGRIDNENEEMKMKQKSAAIKERWQGYARRLRPLYEIKKGLMGQFRMDECGKRACEVESGNIYAARTPSMQRRLSHQSSLFESHKLIIQEQNQGNSHAHKGMNNMLAMSSCPPSRRSSPNHSGVLAVIDVKHKSTTAAATTLLQVAEHCTRKTMNTSAINISKDASSNKVSVSTTNSIKNSKANSKAFPSSNYSSVSTMHELHSALQSAIAHCKESNKSLECLA